MNLQSLKDELEDVKISKLPHQDSLPSGEVLRLKRFCKHVEKYKDLKPAKITASDYKEDIIKHYKHKLGGYLKIYYDKKGWGTGVVAQDLPNLHGWTNDGLWTAKDLRDAMTVPCDGEW